MALSSSTSRILAFAVLLCAGCVNQHKQVSGTDIPKIPQLRHTGTNVNSGSARTLTDGSADFEGPIYDALERARWSEGNFEHMGWTLEKVSGTPRNATAIFYKPVKGAAVERIATLDITADRRDGKATIHFSTRPIDAKAGSPPTDAGSDAPEPNDADAKGAPPTSGSTDSGDAKGS